MNHIPNELIGLFEDKKQAVEVGELYGIELVSFSYGVASFRCEGDAEELIALGEANGWPPLSLNHLFKAF